jgi:hypothetical protein
VSVLVPALPQVGAPAAPEMPGDYPAPLRRRVVRGTIHGRPRMPAVEADEASLVGGLLAAETAEVDDRVVRHRKRHDPVCGVAAALLPLVGAGPEKAPAAAGTARTAAQTAATINLLSIRLPPALSASILPLPLRSWARSRPSGSHCQGCIG